MKEIKKVHIGMIICFISYGIVQLIASYFVLSTELFHILWIIIIFCLSKLKKIIFNYKNIKEKY